MRKKIENAYGNALHKTFKVFNPIKKSIITTDCITHINIQKQSLNILKLYEYEDQYKFFNLYSSEINNGLVWADQDFKSYNHFYNPITKKGLYGYEENALTVCEKYYKKAIDLFETDICDSLFYFGASCHLLHDMTIPQHAKGKLLDNHRPFEIFVKSNYHKVKRYKSHECPIILDNVKDYIDHNSLYAMKIDKNYQKVKDLNSKFYFISIKTVTMAQRSGAGFMLMFFDEVSKKTDEI
ncbi:MAG: zinc dependent phospholipase C family protein [Peptostreptococcaceae bacterium]